MAFCSIVISGSFWFGVGFRGLSPYSSGFLFHHHFLVPSIVSLLFWHSVLFHHHFLVHSASGYKVPGLVSLLLWYSVPSSFPGYFWFRVPGIVSLLFWHSVPSSFSATFWFQLSPYFSILFCVRKGILFIIISWFLPVLARVPGLVSLLFFSFLSQEKDGVPS